MEALTKFNQGVMNLPVHWQLWMALLITANLVVPLFFIGHLEAQFVVGALFASVILMTILTGLTGFTRLVGLGHIFWIPLLYFLWTRIDQIPADSTFGIWIRVLMALNAVSLVIDAVEVSRYIAGDRADAVAGL